MRCNRCEQEYDPDNMSWYGDDPYCEDCFNECFTYCSRCDEAIDRDYARYNSSDEAMCSDCYDDEEDPEAPVNPIVYDSHREEIISLANDWLCGKRPKKFIKINPNDSHLKEIQMGLGLVDYALYLYGLQDREEYQIKASTNLFNRVSQYVTLNNWKIIISHDTGTNRLGLSQSLRESKRQEIIELLSTLTTKLAA